MASPDTIQHLIFLISLQCTTERESRHVHIWTPLSLSLLCLMVMAVTSVNSPNPFHSTPPFCLLDAPEPVNSITNQRRMVGVSCRPLHWFPMAGDSILPCKLTRSLINTRLLLFSLPPAPFLKNFQTLYTPWREFLCKKKKNSIHSPKFVTSAEILHGPLDVCRSWQLNGDVINICMNPPPPQSTYEYLCNQRDLIPVFSQRTTNYNDYSHSCGP